MLKDFELKALLALAIVVLALVLADIALVSQNRSTQQVLSERQAYLQQTLQAEILFREMAKGMAELAIRNNDEELKSLLQAQGILINTGAKPAGQ